MFCGNCGAGLDDANESQLLCPACGASQPVENASGFDWRAVEGEVVGFEDALNTGSVDEIQGVQEGDGDLAFADDLAQEGIEAARLLMGARMAFFMTSDDVDGCVIH